MQRYIVQTHIHGSGSEGLGSYTAHAYAAVQAGHVDLLWWADHDFRLANFAKVREFGFDAQEEFLYIPNRSVDAEEPTTPISMTWEPVEGSDPEGQVTISNDVVHSGTGSYRLELPAGEGERSFTLKFKVAVMHEKQPLFSRPHLRIAVYPAEGADENNYPFVCLRLSQQPPDLEPYSLLYMIGKSGAARLVDKRLEIPVPRQGDGWMELHLDPAADVERYGIPGGLDNSMHTIQIGVTSNGARVVAYFDSLQIEPEITGTRCLDVLRELINSLELPLPTHTGIEASYYGQHLNAFGSTVPIPDYENIPRTEFSSRYIVDHIHCHGGLASLNHPPASPQAVKHLVEQRAYDVDLIEVAHAAGGLLARLELFDRLSEHGLTLTGTAASDAHGARERSQAWVNHIWAESLAEADLMEALARGNSYIADPFQFRGTLTLIGPGEVTMGDVVETTQFPALTCRISGLQAGDMVMWLINGHPVHAAILTGADYEEEWQAEAPLQGPSAVRVQVYRPRLATAAFGGLIVASNPIFVTNTPLETRHRVHRL